MLVYFKYIDDGWTMVLINCGINLEWGKATSPLLSGNTVIKLEDSWGDYLETYTVASSYFKGR